MKSSGRVTVSVIGIASALHRFIILSPALTLKAKAYFTDLTLMMKSSHYMVPSPVWSLSPHGRWVAVADDLMSFTRRQIGTAAAGNAALRRKMLPAAVAQLPWPLSSIMMALGDFMISRFMHKMVNKFAEDAQVTQQQVGRGGR